MEQETNTTTEAANKKVWIRPLVVICGGEKPGSKLKKTIGDAGFKLQPITVLKDLEESAAAHGTSKPLAFLMWVRSAERQITVIKRALQFVPLGRFVIFAPGLTSPPARIAPAVERKERLLWLSSSAQDDDADQKYSDERTRRSVHLYSDSRYSTARLSEASPPSVSADTTVSGVRPSPAMGWPLGVSQIADVTCRDEPSARS